MEIKPSTELLEKYGKLVSYIRDLKSVAVAYSSGVDSTFLLYAAKEALGDKAVALTASSCFFPNREKKESDMFCKEQSIEHIVVEEQILDVPGVAENPENRCYLCKKNLFSKFLQVANQNGLEAVIEGSNLDDEGDYRPGLLAIKELGIISPLRKIGFTKEEIRTLSKHFGLYTFDKPSFACLASRFPYHETITEAKLSMVEKGEDLLIKLGFKQFRVRIHGDNLARIEVLPEDFDRLISEEIRNTIYEKFKEFGFSFISLDLKGYRVGSMNEVIKH